MDALNERLLTAWLQLSVNLTNERVVSAMPFKEALVCNLLSKAGGRQVTATELCEETKMLKSQMNRVLTSLEEKGLICRERSVTDKRQVYVTLAREPERTALFREEHARNLRVVDEVIARFGAERTEQLVGELTEISEIVEEILV